MAAQGARLCWRLDGSTSRTGCSGSASDFRKLTKGKPGYGRAQFATYFKACDKPRYRSDIKGLRIFGSFSEFLPFMARVNARVRQDPGGVGIKNPTLRRPDQSLQCLDLRPGPGAVLLELLNREVDRDHAPRQDRGQFRMARAAAPPARAIATFSRSLCSSWISPFMRDPASGPLAAQPPSLQCQPNRRRWKCAKCGSRKVNVMLRWPGSVSLVQRTNNAT